MNAEYTHSANFGPANSPADGNDRSVSARMKRALSLRFRMMLLFCVVVAVLLAVSYAAFYFALRSVVRTQLDRRLAETEEFVAADLATDSNDEDIAAMNIPGEYFQSVNSSGTVVALSKNLHGRAISVVPFPQSFQTLRDPVLGPLRLRATPLRHGRVSETLLLAMSTRDTDQILSRFRNLLLILFPVSLLVIGAVSAWYVGRSLKPIASLTRETSQMAGRVKFAGTGAISARSSPRNPPLTVANRDDELGRLASAFNELFVCMEGAVLQLRQFVSDASHELRTPLSILQGEAELLLQEPRSPAEYHRALSIIDSELKKLSRIVESLFTLAMADAGQLRLAREPLYLNETLEEACAFIAPRASSKGICIERALSEEIPYVGDEAFLRQLFLIFLDNSVKYSDRPGVIRVTLAASNGAVRIQFQDQGVGILADHVPHIFDRFYRVPQADGSEAQSGGLGLAIAQAIVRAQNGAIECVSSPGSGSTFTISLPSVAESALVQS